MREIKLNDMASWLQEQSEATVFNKPLMIDKATDTFDVKQLEVESCSCRKYDSDASILNFFSKELSKECQCAKHDTKEFLDAVFTGNFDLLEICLDQGIDVHATDDYGDTALHMVSDRGDINMLRFLLSLKPPLNVNAQNKNGLTPLSMAIIGTHNQCAELLLERGADPNISDKNGRTPLGFSVFAGNTSLAKLLLKYNAHVNAVDCFGGTPLSIALVEKPLVNMVHVLLSSGANPVLGISRLNPFLEAVLDCTNPQKLETIKVLINYGTDVNVVDRKSKRNCLHLTAINGFLPLAEYLVNLGASLEQLDIVHRNPHQVATDHKNYEVADFYLKAMWLRRVFYKVAMIRKYGKTRKFTLVEMFRES